MNKAYSLDDIRDLIDRLLDVYSELAKRLDIMYRIKMNLKKLYPLIDKDLYKYYYRSLLLIHDVIAFTNSEDFTYEQICSICKVLKELINKNYKIDEKQFDLFDDVLMKNDLDCIQLNKNKKEVK